MIISCHHIFIVMQKQNIEACVTLFSGFEISIFLCEYFFGQVKIQPCQNLLTLEVDIINLFALINKVESLY